MKRLFSILLTVILVFGGASGLILASPSQPAMAQSVENLLTTLSINDVSGKEVVGVATFTVTLSSPSSFPVTVDYSTADGTAKAGSDYTATSGKLEFPAGETIKTISVPIINDHLGEFLETFYLNLENPTNATIRDYQGIGIISSDEGDNLYDALWEGIRWCSGWQANGHYYVVYYGPEAYRTDAQYYAEASSFHGVQGHLATITYWQEQVLINQLRLDLMGGQVDPHQEWPDTCWGTCWIGLQHETIDDPWYWDTGEPVTFINWDGMQAYSVDHYAWMCTVEIDEMLDDSGFWWSSSNGDMHLSRGFAIEYPNPPPTADAGQDQSVTEGTMVTLGGGNSSDPDGDYPLAFSWQVSAKPDGSTVALDDPGSVTPCFTPDVLGTYVITLVVADSYGAESGLDQVTVTVKNLQPTLSINDVTVNEGADIAAFTVSLSSPSSFPVTVNYSTADGTATAGNDYTDTSGTLTFAPSETAKTIAVPIIEDLLYEGPKTFSLNLDTPTNATISDGQGIGTILDDDLLPPELMVEDLIDVVDATDLPEATKTSLIASLNTAMKVLEDSNPKNDVAAINSLEAFINKIEAQRGKKIPDEIADELITKAQEIIAELSGGT